MRVHFWNRNIRDTVVILEEGNLSHPRCPLCGMLVSLRALNWTHRRIAECKLAAERKQWRLVAVK